MQEQRNMQYLLHKDFGVKANTMEKGFQKGFNEKNFVW